MPYLNYRELWKRYCILFSYPSIGTGKTVTGVHIAYWFAHLNRKRKPAIGEDGTKSTGAMVFYCGPSNKSVDVVARKYY